MTHRLAIAALAVLWVGAQLRAAELQVLLPQGRAAYQTNERITVSVVRRHGQALPAGELTLSVAGQDGSRLVFAFPLPAVTRDAATPAPVDQAGKPDVLATDHFQLNAALLRPGKYTVTAAAHGGSASASIEIASHVRKSSYRVVHWGCTAAKGQQALLGEDSLGYNLAMNAPPPTDDLVRAQVDFMGTCLMGGMHQHDGRIECDWSDPYVTGGAIQRAMVRAFPYRTWGNMIGAHLHDEPGLTYAKHPRTGQFAPYDIPQQRAAYQRLFGSDPIWYDEVHPDQPDSLARWIQCNDFRLGFMEAFWRQARFAVEKMKPGFLPVTQSQYAWSALADGHYFNVARSLPVICGHGGYDDYYLMSLNPAWFLESALPRQLEQPTWYLPEWFTMSSEKYRLEHNLCFATGIAGLCTPPTFKPWEPAAQPCTDGIVETNKMMAALGPIFARPAVTRQDVAILFSKSALWYAVAKAKSHRDNEQTEKLAQLYLATRMTHYPTSFVLDEDVLDGTLAAQHKAVLVTGIHYLQPAVKSGLEGFAASGGVVLMTDDCTVPVAGAVKVGHANDRYWNAREDRIAQIRDPKERARENAASRALVHWCDWCQGVAKAVKARLLERGLAPAFESDARGLATGLQRRGEIDYVFAINFTPTQDVSNTPAAIEARVALPSRGRAVYDAVRGGTVGELDAQGRGQFRFGAGQMRVFAVTARPIGGVQVAPPVISADLTRAADPIVVEITALLRDSTGGVLAGTAPMQVEVTDPAGQVRYALYRAAERGVLSLKLPLAANDPAGTWRVTARELLGNTEGNASFTFRPTAVCGAAAGAVRRALLFEPDRQNIYSLFQSHKAWTIVTGSGEAVGAAAQRLAESLKPYGIHGTLVAAADVKPRRLTAEELKTWTAYGGVSADNPLSNGYDLPGPAILLGNARNNPVLALVAQSKKWHPELPSLMPYEPSEFVPGRGRAMIGWHMYPIGRRLETVSLLADDPAGLSEAVGTLMEIVAGIEPLLALEPPVCSRVTGATASRPSPGCGALVWHVVLPDRAVSIQSDGGRILVTSLDGAVSTFDGQGKLVARQAAAPPALPNPRAIDSKELPPGVLTDRVPKAMAASESFTAVGYWGGTLQLYTSGGDLQTQRQLPQDIASLAWHGDLLVIGLADGRLVAIRN